MPRTWIPLQREIPPNLLLSSTLLLGVPLPYPDLISYSLFTKCQPSFFFFMLSFRSRKTRWLSEVLPQGACLTRIVSDGPPVPMMLNECSAQLCSEWLLLRSQVHQSPSHKRFDVSLCSLNMTLPSSKDQTSCMALYLTQRQPSSPFFGGSDLHLLCKWEQAIVHE